MLKKEHKYFILQAIGISMGSLGFSMIVISRVNNINAFYILGSFIIIEILISVYLIITLSNKRR